METPLVTVFTNDKNMWLLNGFQYLFRKYWSSEQEVIVAGYSPPTNGFLKDNFSFFSIDRKNYPASEWSNGLLKSLRVFQEWGEEFVIMFLEDYWLTEPADRNIIEQLTQYLYEQPRDILRIDLTTDRCQHDEFIIDGVAYKDCKIIRTGANAPYQMSFQAAIWNVDLLMEVLQPNEDPWTSEVIGSRRLMSAGDKYIVLGTRNNPVKYQPVYRTKRAALDISRLTAEDQEMILKRGWV
jgi:hypothetical protein